MGGGDPTEEISLWQELDAFAEMRNMLSSKDETGRFDSNSLEAEVRVHNRSNQPKILIRTGLRNQF